MPPNLTNCIMLTKDVCYTNAMYHQEESSSMHAICSQTTRPDNIKDLLINQMQHINCYVMLLSNFDKQGVISHDLQVASHFPIEYHTTDTVLKQRLHNNKLYCSYITTVTFFGR